MVQSACSESSGLVSLLVGLDTAVLVLATGAMSWRAWEWAGAKGDANGQFLSALSALITLLFAASILLQGAAGFVFTSRHR